MLSHMQIPKMCSPKEETSSLHLKIWLLLWRWDDCVWKMVRKMGERELLRAKKFNVYDSEPVIWFERKVASGNIYEYGTIVDGSHLIVRTNKLKPVPRFIKIVD